MERNFPQALKITAWAPIVNDFSDEHWVSKQIQAAAVLKAIQFSLECKETDNDFACEIDAEKVIHDWKCCNKAKRK